MNRRSFLGVLAGLPFVGSLFARDVPKVREESSEGLVLRNVHVESRVIEVYRAEIVKDGRVIAVLGPPLRWHAERQIVAPSKEPRG